ncbi:MAG TPA: hypothetical protein V6D50_17185 [Chroococcales cyanobacterium]|jgi:hypothetical protein
MNTQQANTTPSGGHLTLPEPDPDNITVLTRNLPNKPILPWMHYDSPWREGLAENEDESQNTDDINESSDPQAVTAAEQEAVETTDESETTEGVNESSSDRLTSLAEPVEETPTDELTG